MAPDNRKTKIIAELEVVPLGGGSTSVGREVAVALSAIERVEGITCQLTPMGTIMEAEGLDPILRAVKAAHLALVEIGVQRIVSDLRIDDRRDKRRSMSDKVKSVQRYRAEVGRKEV